MNIGKNGRFICYGPAGGGYGNPLERDPANVADDVLDELISPATALRDYGVVISDQGRGRPGGDGEGARQPLASREFVALLDQGRELRLLLGDAVGHQFLGRSAGVGGGLLGQVAQVVPQDRDPVVHVRDAGETWAFLATFFLVSARGFRDFGAFFFAAFFFAADFREADFFFAAMFPPEPELRRDHTPASAGNLELAEETARAVVDEQSDKAAAVGIMQVVHDQGFGAIDQGAQARAPRSRA